MNPHTSFLLPIRNGEATIELAVASVLAQTESDLELVVVDDGSSDSTGARLAAWAARDRRVVHLTQPPLGIVAALNHGLSRCRGTLVARMDGDDTAHPRRLERQLPYFAEDPFLGVLDTQVALFCDDGPVPEGMATWARWINGILTPDDFRREWLVESPIVHPAATFPRQLVLALGGYRDGPFPEDYDLWLRIARAGYRLRKVPEVLHGMRDGPGRLTRTDPRYGRDGLRRVREDWLAATALSRPRKVALWSGAKGGRPWLRWLRDRGHDIVAVLDIAPSRAGTRRGDVPVVGLDALEDLRADVLLVAVGSRGARDLIRQELSARRPDWVEGRDWWAVL